MEPEAISSMRAKVKWQNIFIEFPAIQAHIGIFNSEALQIT